MRALGLREVGKVRSVVFVALVLALAGCTASLDVSGTEWVRPDTGVGQASWDEMECLRAATNAGQTQDVIVGGVADAVRFALREGGRNVSYGRCMRALGYAKVAVPAPHEAWTAR